MRAVVVGGIGQVAVKKKYDKSLRALGAEVVGQALADAGRDFVDALYLGNMLSDELQGQKHLAALVADEAGLAGIEAIQLRAATASGAAALRMAYLAVASGAVDSAVAVGVEKMSVPGVTSVLAKALDAHQEVADGATLLSQNARLMACYQETYRPPVGALASFSVNAHCNARHNPYALFREKEVTPTDVLESRVVNAPLRLLDCAPICDGAAAALLLPAEQAGGDTAVKILASAVATDRFRIADRRQPLRLEGAARSARKAYSQAGIDSSQVSFFELHDAFTIMSCLLLEASGFAAPGEGWRLGLEGAIARDGVLPITTMGGLKARGHPIGATALYQVCEIVLQLTGRAGPNQLPDPRTALMQSVGGAAATVITHIFQA